MKREFTQAVVMVVVLYSYTTWNLAECQKKKLDGNNSRMPHAVLNKSWKQHPTKQQLYSYLPPISQTI